jgi:hypothetical protein
MELFVGSGKNPNKKRDRRQIKPEIMLYSWILYGNILDRDKLLACNVLNRIGTPEI